MATVIFIKESKQISSVIASRYLAVFYEKIGEPEIPRQIRIDQAF